LAKTPKKQPKKVAIAASNRSTGDNITLGLAVAAAAASSMFAGYMWTNDPTASTDGRLIFETVSIAKNDENRTDVRPVSPTVGARRTVVSADPITTASTFDAGPPRSAPAAPPRLERFVLLGIYADTALVSETRSGASKLWPVKIGSSIPGAGRIIAFIADSDSPSILTSAGLIAARSTKP